MRRVFWTRDFHDLQRGPNQKKRGSRPTSPFLFDNTLAGLMDSDGDLLRLRFVGFRDVNLENAVAVVGFDFIALDRLR